VGGGELAGLAGNLMMSQDAQLPPVKSRRERRRFAPGRARIPLIAALYFVGFGGAVTPPTTPGYSVWRPGRGTRAKFPADGKEMAMKKTQPKKLRLHRETVLRLEHLAPIRAAAFGRLAGLGKIPETSPLCVSTCCGGCDVF